MLENLKQLVKENAQEAIVNNNEVPNEKNEAVMDAASGSIIDALKQKFASGDVAGLVDAFKNGGGGDNAVVNQASSGFTEKLAGMGINMESAKRIAASLIPSVVGKFVNKTNDPNDNSFNLQDIMSNIAGPDGKFDLSDLTGMLGGDKQSEGGASGGSGGSLMDKVKGFFK